MLKIQCPYCHHDSSLIQVKEGKFTTTCKHCQSKFHLLIKLQADGKFTSTATKLSGRWKKEREAGDRAKLQTPGETRGGFDETADRPNQTVKSTGGTDEATDPTHPSDARPNPGAQSVPQPPKRVETTTTKRASPQALAIGTNLGPYRLIKLLGQGGMGSVYLAKQTTLDREVALKVINTQLSNSPKALARFTREAYAAAQLIHPNVVQVYDMGDDRGTCYFSMELVQGRSLADLVVNEKKLDPEQAASFILHAARGLAYAHRIGMVHRDIKPGNLLVDASGTVKVADLGLVKVPDQDEIEETSEIGEFSALSASHELTGLGTAVGTPYYMAPEQAKNAVTVDHRADIYSLGCTFYVLLTGKKPFDGRTFEEIVSKHHSAPLIEPSEIEARVPSSLSSIVAKMMAKTPEGRYQSLNELIPDLEKFLGISSAATFTPDEGDVVVLEKSAKEFNQIPLVKLRDWIALAVFAGSFLIALITLFASWKIASAVFAMPFFAVAAYFVVAGIRQRGALFEKARELVFHSGLSAWVKWMFAGLVFVFALYLTGLLIPWFIVAVIGMGLGSGFHFLVDRTILQSRLAPIAEIEKLLRKMRLKGMDELAIQSLVAKYSGKHWEELYEVLFGYKAKRSMRDELAKSELGKTRPKFRAWRDRIFDSWSRQVAAIKDAKAKRHLQKIESASLQAEGLSAAQATERASQLADALVDHAAELKIAALEKRVAELDPTFRSSEQRLRIKNMLADAKSGKYRKSKTWLQELEPQLNRFAGGYLRFLLGSLLMVGSLMWAKQNGILGALQESATRITQAAQISEDQNLSSNQAIKDAVVSEKDFAVEALTKETNPLGIPFLGSLLFNNFNALIAGLILMTSAIVFGWRMSLFAIPAAGVALLGERFMAMDIESTQTIHSLSALIAAGIYILGIVFGRAED